MMKRINKNIAKRYPWLLRPEIPDCDLQEAVDCAEFCLLLQSAILYGLVTGNASDINQEQCLRVLEYGKSKGFTPTPTKLNK